jgi:molybdate transport system substrate-binding protein
MFKPIAAIIGSLCVLSCTAGIASAAEIKVVAAGALRAAFAQLIPDFQKSTGHTVTITYGPAGAVAGRVEKGEAADVVITGREQLATLEARGKVAPGSRVNIAGVGMGVAVRKGAPKPDIGSLDAFKRSLLAAKSVGHVNPATGSSSGIFTASLLEKIGLAQTLRPKTRLGTFEELEHAVEKGEVEIQIGQATELVSAPALEYAGPLPAEIQNITQYAAGVVSYGKIPDAAKAFINFISTPAAVGVFKAKGYEPG